MYIVLQKKHVKIIKLLHQFDIKIEINNPIKNNNENSNEKK